MTNDFNWFESLVSAETVSAVTETVRRSGARPSAIASALTAHAQAVIADRPAEAAAAAFLADVVAPLERPTIWKPWPQLSNKANAALATADMATNLWAAVCILRDRRAELNELAALIAAHRHTDLNSRGYTTGADGLQLALAVGVALGGIPLVRAHVFWARHHEDDAPLKAAHHMTRALSLVRAHGDADERDWVETAVRSFFKRRGMPVRAVANASSPRDRSRKRPSRPVSESNANSLRDEGRYQEALTACEEALSVPTEIVTRDSEKARLRLLSLRGLLHEDLGEQSLAELDWEAAVDLARQLGDPHAVFSARADQAAGFLKRQDYKRGVAAFRDILFSVDAAGDAGHRPAALNNLATAYSFAGDYGSSARCYRDVLELLSSNPLSDSRLLALTGLASCYEKLGDQAGLAEVAKDFERFVLVAGSVELTSENGSMRTPRTERAMNEYFLSGAADLDVPRIREGSENTRRRLLEDRDLVRSGSITMKLSKYAKRQGRPSEALRLIEEFLSKFATERANAEFCIIAEVEASKLIAHHLGERNSALLRLRTAIHRVEKRLGSVERSDVGDSILERARPLYVLLAELLLEKEEPGGYDEAFWLHEASRPMTLTKSTGTLGSHRVRNSRVVNLADVRGVLDAEERPIAVLSFFETSDGLGAFLVTREVTKWIPIDLNVDDLRQASSELSVAFNGDPDRFPPRRPAVVSSGPALKLPHTEKALSALGKAMPAPSVGLVLIVPSPAMDGLPLHAMCNGSGEFLIDRAATVLEPSLTALADHATRASTEPVQRQVLVTGVAAREDIRSDFFETEMQLFDGFDSAYETLSGLSATPTAVLRGLSRSDIAHVACHGFVDRHDPAGSGLLMSDGRVRPSRRRNLVPLGERNNFELTARDLKGGRVDIRLLTMRACSASRNTGVTANAGSSTLSKAFQDAGCRTVVSALWNVDQQSSREFFRYFYDLVLHGETAPCDAIRRAQQWMARSSEGERELYHWAPFVVSGDWYWTNHGRR